MAGCGDLEVERLTSEDWLPRTRGDFARFTENSNNSSAIVREAELAFLQDDYVIG